MWFVIDDYENDSDENENNSNDAYEKDDDVVVVFVFWCGSFVFARVSDVTFATPFREEA